MREFFWLLGLVALSALGWLLWRMLEGTAVPSLDWVIGLVTLLWLLVIVTVPWNIHFQAREVLVDVHESRKRGIAVDDDKASYAALWVQRSLAIAIGLHAATALILLWVAVSGVSIIGYFGAAASVLLTFARPIMRGYLYLRTRLTTIRTEIRYPHEDVAELKLIVKQVQDDIAEIKRHLDVSDANSWAARQDAVISESHAELERLRVALDDLRQANKLDHERISRDAQNAMAQVMGDAAIVNHVREIVRFFKQA
jgi:hypothetical protein